MKIYILKNNLKKALNIVEKVVSKSLTLPILNNVLLSTEKHCLKLSVTDLEIGINYWTLAKVEKQGSTAIPVKFLTNFINSIPDSKISLEVKDTILYIEGKNYKTKIKTFNPEEFPIIPKIKEEHIIELDNLIFSQGLSQVVENASISHIRPEISGVYISFQKDVITMAATDSFRLAEKKIFSKQIFKSENKKEYSIIIPQKTVRELINILPNQKGKIKIYFSSNQVMFECLSEGSGNPEFQIISRLIEGKYPDYQDIIPKKHKTQLILSRQEFINQIKTASLFSGRVNKIKFKIFPEQGKIELLAQDSEIGESSSFFKGKIKGEEIEVFFNWRFLLDGLLGIESEEVIFELNKKQEPAILKPVGNNTFLYVVMPVSSE